MDKARSLFERGKKAASNVASNVVGRFRGRSELVPEPSVVAPIKSQEESTTVAVPKEPVDDKPNMSEQSIVAATEAPTEPQEESIGVVVPEEPAMTQQQQPVDDNPNVGESSVVVPTDVAPTESQEESTTVAVPKDPTMPQQQQPVADNITRLLEETKLSSRAQNFIRVKFLIKYKLSIPDGLPPVDSHLHKLCLKLWNCEIEPMDTVAEINELLTTYKAQQDIRGSLCDTILNIAFKILFCDYNESFNQDDKKMAFVCKQRIATAIIYVSYNTSLAKFSEERLSELCAFLYRDDLKFFCGDIEQNFVQQVLAVYPLWSYLQQSSILKKYFDYVINIRNTNRLNPLSLSFVVDMLLRTKRDSAIALSVSKFCQKYLEYEQTKPSNSGSGTVLKFDGLINSYIVEWQPDVSSIILCLRVKLIEGNSNYRCTPDLLDALSRFCASISGIDFPNRYNSDYVELCALCIRNINDSENSDRILTLTRIFIQYFQYFISREKEVTSRTLMDWSNKILFQGGILHYLFDTKTSYSVEISKARETLLMNFLTAIMQNYDVSYVAEYLLHLYVQSKVNYMKICEFIVEAKLDDAKKLSIIYSYIAKIKFQNISDNLTQNILKLAVLCFKTSRDLSISVFNLFIERDADDTHLSRYVFNCILQLTNKVASAIILSVLMEVCEKRNMCDYIFQDISVLGCVFDKIVLQNDCDVDAIVKFFTSLLTQCPGEKCQDLCEFILDSILKAGLEPGRKYFILINTCRKYKMLNYIFDSGYDTEKRQVLLQNIFALCQTFNTNSTIEFAVFLLEKYPMHSTVVCENILDSVYKSTMARETKFQILYETYFRISEKNKEKVSKLRHILDSNFVSDLKAIELLFFTKHDDPNANYFVMQLLQQNPKCLEMVIRLPGFYERMDKILSVTPRNEHMYSLYLQSLSLPIEDQQYINLAERRLSVFIRHYCTAIADMKSVDDILNNLFRILPLQCLEQIIRDDKNFLADILRCFSNQSSEEINHLYLSKLAAIILYFCQLSDPAYASQLIKRYLTLLLAHINEVQDFHIGYLLEKCNPLCREIIAYDIASYIFQKAEQSSCTILIQQARFDDKDRHYVFEWLIRNDKYIDFDTLLTLLPSDRFDLSYFERLVQDERTFKHMLGAYCHFFGNFVASRSPDDTRDRFLNSTSMFADEGAALVISRFMNLEHSCDMSQIQLEQAKTIIYVFGCFLYAAQHRTDNLLQILMDTISPYVLHIENSFHKENGFTEALRYLLDPLSCNEDKIRLFSKGINRGVFIRMTNTYGVKTDADSIRLIFRSNDCNTQNPNSRAIASYIFRHYKDIFWDCDNSIAFVIEVMPYISLYEGTMLLMMFIQKSSVASVIQETSSTLHDQVCCVLHSAIHSSEFLSDRVNRVALSNLIYSFFLALGDDAANIFSIFATKSININFATWISIYSSNRSPASMDLKAQLDFWIATAKHYASPEYRLALLNILIGILSTIKSKKSEVEAALDALSNAIGCILTYLPQQKMQVFMLLPEWLQTFDTFCRCFEVDASELLRLSVIDGLQQKLFDIATTTKQRLYVASIIEFDDLQLREFLFTGDFDKSGVTLDDLLGIHNALFGLLLAASIGKPILDEYVNTIGVRVLVESLMHINEWPEQIKKTETCFRILQQCAKHHVEPSSVDVLNLIERFKDEDKKRICELIIDDASTLKCYGSLDFLMFAQQLRINIYAAEYPVILRLCDCDNLNANSIIERLISLKTINANHSSASKLFDFFIRLPQAHRTYQVMCRLNLEQRDDILTQVNDFTGIDHECVVRIAQHIPNVPVFISVFRGIRENDDESILSLVQNINIRLDIEALNDAWNRLVEKNIRALLIFLSKLDPPYGYEISNWINVALRDPDLPDQCLIAERSKHSFVVGINSVFKDLHNIPDQNMLLQLADLIQNKSPGYKWWFMIECYRSHLIDNGNVRIILARLRIPESQCLEDRILWEDSCIKGIITPLCRLINTSQDLIEAIRDTFNMQLQNTALAHIRTIIETIKERDRSNFKVCLDIIFQNLDCDSAEERSENLYSNVFACTENCRVNEYSRDFRIGLVIVSLMIYRSRTTDEDYLNNLSEILSHLKPLIGGIVISQENFTLFFDTIKLGLGADVLRTHGETHDKTHGENVIDYLKEFTGHINYSQQVMMNNLDIFPITLDKFPMVKNTAEAKLLINPNNAQQIAQLAQWCVLTFADFFRCIVVFFAHIFRVCIEQVSLKRTENKIFMRDALEQYNRENSRTHSNRAEQQDEDFSHSI